MSWENDWNKTVSPRTRAHEPEPVVSDVAPPPRGRAWRNGETTTIAADGFGATLRAARLAAHLSQVALSERINLDHSLIARYETGKKTPSRKTAQRLANVLGDEIMISAGFVPDGYTAVRKDETA